MKKIFLLVTIFIIFIALGLPDALLGSGWNEIRFDLDVPLSSIGISTLITYVMTIFSTYNAPKILRKVSTKYVTLASVLLSSISLLLISRTQAFYQMVLLAIPLGLSAGAIDLSVNHYVAHNYKASTMNYLHSFYGMGVTFGPSIMALTLFETSNWRLAYIIVSGILFLIFLLTLISLPYWHPETEESRAEQHAEITTLEAVKIKGVKQSLIIILSYVHIESLASVFVASYAFLVLEKEVATAALFTTLYFLALTLGRLFSGFISKWISSKNMIYLGLVVMGVGVITMILSLVISDLGFYGVFFLGFGCGPIFPNMMYLNAQNFRKDYSSKVTSLQMVIGYLGFGMFTPLAGVMFDFVSMKLYPLYILLILLILSFFVLWYQKKITSQNKTLETLR